MHDENYIYSPKFVHQESILNKYQLKNEYAHTWQIPGLTLVKINLRNDFELYLFPVDLPLKVVDDEFLISGMEPETWRQTDGLHCSLCSSSQNSHSKSVLIRAWQAAGSKAIRSKNVDSHTKPAQRALYE